MTKHEVISISDGLNKMVNHIKPLASQAPPHARAEGIKIEYPRKAVIGYMRSDAAVRSIVSSNFTFNGFVTALHEGIQVENNINLLSTETRKGETGVLFHRYGRNHRHVKKHGHSPGQR